MYETVIEKNMKEILPSVSLRIDAQTHEVSSRS